MNVYIICIVSSIYKQRKEIENGKNQGNHMSFSNIINSSMSFLGCTNHLGARLEEGMTVGGALLSGSTFMFPLATFRK